MNEDLENIMRDSFTNYIGPGSNEDRIIPFKEEFPEIIKKYLIGSVNDAGCGLGWIKAECMKLGVKYSGFDILPREGAKVLDITSEVMPKADLIICRDVLFHLTNDLIEDALGDFKKSGIYLLATSHYGVSNETRPDSYEGHIINNFVDLEKILGTPLDKIEEPIDNRYMGIWKLNV